MSPAPKKKVREALPRGVDRALLSYERFTADLAEAASEDDPQTFGRRHAASKAALMHITALLRLADSLSEEEARQPSRDTAAEMVAEARAALLELRIDSSAEEEL